MILTNPKDFLHIAYKWNKEIWGDESIPNNIFMFIQNGTVCGSISIVDCDLLGFEQFTPWLANFYVLPEFRRKGIGLKLMNHCLSLYNVLYCYTEDIALSNVYKSWGWNVIDNQDEK